MSFSKEYTYWHLTPSGWVAGETRIDIGRTFDVSTPQNTVLTIKYGETMSSGFSDLKVTEDIIFEIDDKNTIAELRKKFPDTFCISPPNQQ